MEQLYQQRLKRYVTAMRNGKPDRVPVRPFVAEFTAKYAGYDCQQVTHDYRQAFAAARKCAADFDWDAVVGNMVYVWTGLSEAIGLRYYAAPGLHIAPDVAFQYREPPEDQAWMRADEYDQLIADPTEFLFNVWLPRITYDVAGPGQPNTYRNQLSFLRGGMAMLNYFNAFGEQNRLLREESGTAGAIAGIFKAPMDILADKLRGYLGLCNDLMVMPQKVEAACRALMPHLFEVALAGSDPAGTMPIGYWMHRGCVPFVSMRHFSDIYWPTTRPILEELWRRGRQTLCYAEGKWAKHTGAFAELPDRSVVFHVDRDDIAEVHKAIGHKFCLSGGISNYLLAFGTPQQMRDDVKRVLDAAAGDGGYIADAGAIVQQDASIENMRVLTDTVHELGRYGGGDYAMPPAAVADPAATGNPFVRDGARSIPGTTVAWPVKRKDYGDIPGDEALVRSIWQENDFLPYLYIWQVLLSF